MGDGAEVKQQEAEPPLSNSHSSRSDFDGLSPRAKWTLGPDSPTDDLQGCCHNVQGSECVNHCVHQNAMSWLLGVVEKHELIRVKDLDLSDLNMLPNVIIRTRDSEHNVLCAGNDVQMLTIPAFYFGSAVTDD